MLRDQNI